MISLSVYIFMFIHVVIKLMKEISARTNKIVLAFNRTIVRCVANLNWIHFHLVTREFSLARCYVTLSNLDEKCESVWYHGNKERCDSLGKDNEIHFIVEYLQPSILRIEIVTFRSAHNSLLFFFKYRKCKVPCSCSFNPSTSAQSCCFGIDIQLCSGKPELFGIGNQLCSGKPRYLTWYEGKVRMWVSHSLLQRYCDCIFLKNRNYFCISNFLFVVYMLG